MKNNKLIFAPKFKHRLEAIAEYLYLNTKSKEVVRAHISNIKTSLQILRVFPQLGREANEFGNDIRKLVILDYTVLYTFNENEERIEVLNIFRENLP
jgi:plasmid stabilization system protein ParE